MNYHRGPFTKSYIRTLAMSQGYRIASHAEATKTGWYAMIWVWGWDKDRQRIITCRFYACREHPTGHCEFPPVTDTTFSTGGVQSNQLRFNLKGATP